MKRIEYPKQLSGPPSFFWIFPLLLKELTIIFFSVLSGHSKKDKMKVFKRPSKKDKMKVLKTSGS